MIKIKKILNYSLFVSLLLPIVTLAEEVGLMLLIKKVEDLFSAILPLILSLAIIYFLWGLTRYMLKAGEEQADARQQMVWGIIILFVMVSIWGFVSILSATIFG